MQFSFSAAALTAGLLIAVPAQAQTASPFTTVNIDRFVNANVPINPTTLPTGLSTGNMGTDIPFLISSRIAGRSSVYIAPGTVGATLTVDLAPLGITGQQSFYALLNNFNGTAGSNEYNVIISSATRSVAYASIGGVDTRDYNFNPDATNTIDANTTAWFDNQRPGASQRYDVRRFTLGADFGSETLTSFQIVQLNARNRAVFAGLTFSTLPAGVTGAVPEPATWAMMIGGFGLVGASLRRRTGNVTLA